ncbi:hypothetical protein [Streptomyces sp. NPDC050416]|uniref:hypothetical protein n=1 Tax=Streptomyces sp. NPDC050416 TaxID=3365611 RepID=UPI0037B4769C
MWNLQESRRRFYSEQQSKEVNYWVSLFESEGKGELLQGEEFNEFREWRPTRSNCPELEGMMDDLIHVAPLAWKATLRNIFAARVADGEANASAWSSRQSGVVEINQGFTNAAIVYATLFSQFFDAMHTIVTDVDLGMDDDEVLWWILEEIDRGAVDPVLLAEEAASVWRQQRSVIVAHKALTDVPKHRVDSYRISIAAAEEFVLAHEISHHLLGHTDEFFKHSVSVSREMASWIERSGIRDLWSSLNQSQRSELEADVAAFLLMSGELGGDLQRGQIYKAISGSMLSLIALSHISGHWHSEDASGTHPDFITRYAAIAAIVHEMSREIPMGAHDDHPEGFLLQFRGFISLVLQCWSSRRIEEVKRPHFLNVFSWILDESASLEEKLRRLNQVQK